MTNVFNLDTEAKTQTVGQTHPDLVAIRTLEERLDELKSGQNFARSLVGQFKEKGRLSDKQWPYVRKFAEQLTQPTPPETDAAPATTPFDATAILEHMEVAKGNGLKKPTLIFGDEEHMVKIAAAGAESKNHGQYYVVLDDDYMGRLAPGGSYTQVKGTPPILCELINEFNKNPVKQARLYGRRTGTCCCCGRELTNHASIDAGIGPICAEKWGM